MERWTQIKEFPNYSISKHGRVLGMSGKILTGGIDTKGYHIVCIRDGRGGQTTRKVHRLVAIHFLDNPNNKPQVNHKDSNKLNNHVDNLEWATNSENIAHKMANGLNREAQGEDLGNAKLRNAEAVEIFRSSLPRRVLAERFGVSVSTVRNIQNRKIWKHITKGLRKIG